MMMLYHVDAQDRTGGIWWAHSQLQHPP